MITEDTLRQLMADDERVVEALVLVTAYAGAPYVDGEEVIHLTHQIAAHVIATYPEVDVPEPVLAAFVRALIYERRTGEMPTLVMDVEPPPGRPN